MSNLIEDLDISPLTMCDRVVLMHYKKAMISKFHDGLQREPLDLSMKSNVCNICDSTFDHKNRLKAHMRRHNIKESGRYTCKVCLKKFVQQSSLITHIRIHTGERPYHCKICDSSYGDLSTFTKHKRIHSGERPYPCHICGRRFSQSGNCLRHIRSVHFSACNNNPGTNPAGNTTLAAIPSVSPPDPNNVLPSASPTLSSSSI